MKIISKKEEHTIEVSSQELKDLHYLLFNLPPGEIVSKSKNDNGQDAKKEVFISKDPTTLSTSEDDETKTPISKKSPNKKVTILVIISVAIILLALSTCTVLTNSAETREKIIGLIHMICNQLMLLIQTLTN